MSLPLRSRRPRRLRPVRALAAAGLAVLLTAPAAAQADGWYPGAALTPGVSAQNAHLVTRPGGNEVAAWSDAFGVQSGTATIGVFTQQLVNGAVPGPPVRLDTITTAGNGQVQPLNETHVAAAAGAAGTGVAAWNVPLANNAGRVRFARLRADGSAAAPITFNTLIDGRPRPAVAVDDRGDAIVAYSDGTDVRATRVAADDSLSTLDLGPADGSSFPEVGVTAAGTAWVAWATAVSVQVVRIDPDGTASAPASYSASSDALSMTVAPDGSAAAVGGVSDMAGADQIAGARLAVSGPVLAGPFSGHSLPSANGQVFVPSLALAPDGTLTIARTGAIANQDPSRFSTVERFAPGAATGTEIPAFGTPTASATPLAPAVTAAPDGRVLLAWATGSLVAPAPILLKARMIAPDGSLGAISDPGTAYGPFEGLLGGRPISGLKPAFTDGSAQLGILEVSQDSAEDASMRNELLDADGPRLDVDVPAQAQVGTPVRLSQAASDARGVVAQSWDFGDSSTANSAAVTHTYGAPGTYTVTASATDGVGNVTEVARQLVVTAVPAAAVAPPQNAGSALPAVIAPKLLAPTIRILTASRTGRTLSVSGTIARTAGGRVTLSYAARVGTALVTQRKTVPIVKGRWRTTLTLNSTILKAKHAATVTIAYSGDKDTAKGSAKRVVKVVKAKAKKKK